MDQKELKETALQYLQGLQTYGVADLDTDVEQRLPLAFESEVPASPPQVAQPSQVNEPKPSTDLTATASNPSLPNSVAPTDTSSASYGSASDQIERIDQLAILSQQVAACELCPELCRNRKNTVFGVGNPQPRIAFFGEGPGADEDRLGEPFVGAAGKLLDKIIAACKIARQDVYILNTVKCRPPGNRNPLESELSNCRRFWQKQLQILQPEYIVCLGSVAAKTLLDTTDSVARLRGKLHSYKDSKVMVTYHPAYLLRTPQAKAKTWDDMKMMFADMGVQL